jgi:hypothetical protein
MRWEGHIASMGGFAYRVLVGKPEAKRLLEDLDVDGRIILYMHLQEVELEHGLD